MIPRLVGPKPSRRLHAPLRCPGRLLVTCKHGRGQFVHVRHKPLAKRHRFIFHAIIIKDWAGAYRFHVATFNDQGPLVRMPIVHAAVSLCDDR